MTPRTLVHRFELPVDLIVSEMKLEFQVSTGEGASSMAVFRELARKIAREKASCEEHLVEGSERKATASQYMNTLMTRNVSSGLEAAATAGRREVVGDATRMTSCADVYRFAGGADPDRVAALAASDEGSDFCRNLVFLKGCLSRVRMVSRLAAPPEGQSERYVLPVSETVPAAGGPSPRADDAR